MPTAEEFASMATQLDAIDLHLSQVPGTVGDAVAATSIRGGGVADLIARCVERNNDDVAAARGMVATLVDTCRAREQQCRRYSDLYNGYLAAVARYQERARSFEPGSYLGSPPWPPMRPGPWAERS